MTYHKRPSNREIDKKILQAKELLKKKRGYFAIPEKCVGELMDLNIGNTEDIWPLVLELLEEIQIKDYKGGHPPQKSYETAIVNCELYAFA